MKISTLIIPASLVLALLAACEPETKPRIRENTITGDHQPTGSTETTFVGSDAEPTPTPAPITVTDESTPPEPTPTPTPAPVTEQQRNIPYGTPVPGKPGFVTSPHVPAAGYVDVRGFPPNMEVKDPYSGKIFLVP